MDRNKTIGVKTTLADGRVEQTIDGMTKRVVDIAAQHQEAAVRVALVQLGWTPPEESEELRRDRDRLLRSLREMVHLRDLSLRSEVDPERHELDVVRDARAAIDSARGVDKAERGAG